MLYGLKRVPVLSNFIRPGMQTLVNGINVFIRENCIDDQTARQAFVLSLLETAARNTGLGGHESILYLQHIVELMRKELEERN